MLLLHHPALVCFTALFLTVVFLFFFHRRNLTIKLQAYNSVIILQIYYSIILSYSVSTTTMNYSVTTVNYSVTPMNYTVATINDSVTTKKLICRLCCHESEEFKA